MSAHTVSFPVAFPNITHTVPCLPSHVTTVLYAAFTHLTYLLSQRRLFLKNLIMHAYSLLCAPSYDEPRRGANPSPPRAWPHARRHGTIRMYAQASRIRGIAQEMSVGNQRSGRQ